MKAAKQRYTGKDIDPEIIAAFGRTCAKMAEASAAMAQSFANMGEALASLSAHFKLNLLARDAFGPDFKWFDMPKDVR